mmetsp:Transcript_109126/g.340104  ORF Transcript_109126/g.340104 Transcript_109126/m.340104 type:complete len:285 (+) Transcript_109126:27-881(+)
MSAVAAARSLGRPLRVALIGYGTIGTYVAKRLVEGTAVPNARLAAVLVRQPRDPVPPLLASSGVLLTTDPGAFFDAEWDIAVEVAGQDAVRSCGERCLKSLGRHFLITSIGALCDDALHSELLSAAQAGGSQLLLAAGALPGVDWMSSAAFEAVEDVTITQTKKPEGWRGTPAEDVVDLASLVQPAVIFEGAAREAATRYPKNANVAAALALATVGLDAARVRLVADPGVEGPRIDIHLRGAAGELDMQVRGRPAFGSQRTSLVVPLSVVKALRNLSAPQFIGI